jgi:F-type H+-transporting ATPase subunit gamma
MAARPYAQMITSVLESLMRRIEIIDPETGNLRHPLFAMRPEKRVLLMVVSGDRGFAGAFNGNIFKAAYQFINGNGDKEIDIESVGRKATDQFRRRYPAAVYNESRSRIPQTAQDYAESSRAQGIEVSATTRHAGKAERRQRLRMAQEHHPRYVHEEIDACYIVYNEFKSVIQQRVVTERLLPMIEIGKHDIAGAIEPTKEEREAAAAGCRSAQASS